MEDYSEEELEEENLKVYQEAHYELVGLNEKVSNLTIEDLKQDKTVLLLKTTKRYLEIYKTWFSEMLKEKFKFNVKSLEEKLKIVEESIEILKD